MKKTHPLVVAYGVGVNSTALLIGLFERQIRPDLILFADTGGEKPETYAYLDVMATFLGEILFPQIITVKRNPYPTDCAGKGATTLEEYCLNTGALPSIAYGWKTCSDQWKGRCQEAYIKDWPLAVDCWASGEKVVQARGYDANEPQRAKYPESRHFTYWYPLIEEWDWAREECIEAIRRHNLPVPPKSACFFCPSSTKKEVLKLSVEHPDLFARAVAMEHAAQDYNTKVKGLGRRFSWEGLVSLPLFDQAGLVDPPDAPCGCFDGD